MPTAPIIPASPPPGLRRFETLLMQELYRLSAELRPTDESASMIEKIILLAVHRRVATDLRKLKKLLNWTSVQLKARGYEGQLSESEVIEPQS